MRLGMPSIAEGVETAAELHLLESLGCDAVQGWHIARPLPAAEATVWLRERVDGTVASLLGGTAPQLRAV